MEPNSCGTRLIACSIFQAEIEYLIASQLLKGPVAYIDSMYHMRPGELEKRLDEMLSQPTGKTDVKDVLVYGECHPGIHRMDEANFQRTKGMNCIELVLGMDQYRKLRREGAFFLLPEWTERWQQVMTEGLGLTEKNARDFFGEMHKKMVYLDTRVTPLPQQALQDIEAFTGLPVQVLPVSLDKLLNTILEAMKGVKS